MLSIDTLSSLLITFISLVLSPSLLFVSLTLLTLCSPSLPSLASRSWPRPATPRCQPQYQGAADDEEGWAHGLRADEFWAHRDMLLRVRETAECERMVVAIVTARANAGSVSVAQAGIDYAFIGALVCDGLAFECVPVPPDHGVFPSCLIPF